jgi:hypothetical protein
MITKFERKRIDNHSLYGKIIKESDNLVLLAQVIDFQFDGFMVVRKKDITKCIVDDSTKYGTKIMKLEKSWPKIPILIRKLNITSWHTLLSDIKSVVIVENERIDSSFYIGIVEDSKRTSVSIRCFDGVGKWQDTEVIKITDITSCTFLDRYSSIHSKYLKRS